MVSMACAVSVPRSSITWSPDRRWFFDIVRSATLRRFSARVVDDLVD